MSKNSTSMLSPARKKTFFVEPDKFQVCSKTVMDTTDPDIVFDQDGISNWWHEFHAIARSRPAGKDLEKQLEEALSRIRREGRGKPHDCILGLSGGVDSSYTAHLAKKWSLRPLVVHFDNGWNDDLAVSNIEQIVKRCGFKLETYVMNWPEFRDLQRSYFLASVLDLEVPTDHMIFGALYQIAHSRGVKYILSGNNFATEWLLPRAWYYSKFDLTNMMGIHREFGTVPLRHLPKLGAWQQLYYRRFERIEDVKILDLIPYKKSAAKATLVSEFGWRDYDGKHCESVFTRFYQGYILPKKYGIDKRKAHLSNLICNGEITRDQALNELKNPPYEASRQESDKIYVAKKLGWSKDEFEAVLSRPPRCHEEFGTDRRHLRTADTALRALVLVKGLLRNAGLVRGNT